MRLIDAEAFEKSVRTDFWEHYTDCHDTDQTDLLELIMDNLAEQPTIEAKPVVHCKDCEYFNPHCQSCFLHWQEDDDPNVFCFQTNPDDYCSFAEKRDNK